MSLAGIVRALGGDLYAAGRRASVPAPGHSPADRSISLLLDGDRVIAHGFGASDWRAAMDELRRLGLVDDRGRLTPVPGGLSPPPPAMATPVLTEAERIRRAAALRDSAGALEGTPAEAYCRRRGLTGPWPEALRHAWAPQAIYADRGRRRPALVAAIHRPDGPLTAVEVTYLTPGGAPALRRPRKMIGVVPPGSAVRLSEPQAAMIVAEGVFSALSAAALFGRPAWALLSAGNLSRWRAPPGVRDVLIAADPDDTGLRAARRLAERLARSGVSARICAPPSGVGDWNDVLAHRRGAPGPSMS